MSNAPLFASVFKKNIFLDALTILVFEIGAAIIVLAPFLAILYLAILKNGEELLNLFNDAPTNYFLTPLILLLQISGIGCGLNYLSRRKKIAIKAAFPITMAFVLLHIILYLLLSPLSGFGSAADFLITLSITTIALWNLLHVKWA